MKETIFINFKRIKNSSTFRDAYTVNNCFLINHYIKILKTEFFHFNFIDEILKNTKILKLKLFVAQQSTKKKFSKKKKNIFRVIGLFLKILLFLKNSQKKFFFFTFWSDFERSSRSSWSRSVYNHQEQLSYSFQVSEPKYMY